MRIHQDKVQAVVNQVKSLNTNGEFVSLRKDSVSHMVPQPLDPKHKDRKVRMHDLNKILEIDTKNKICVVEPGVTFSDLVRKTLKVGFIPYLVPELKTITCGGAVSGCSIESMSYKYGGFHDSCLEYEVVTGDGTVLTCSPQKNSEVFNMIHGSYGTLGIITKITFRLIEAKKFVRMDYHLFDNLAEFKEAMTSHIEKRDFDFIDGIIHAKDKFILCLGQMTDTAPYTSSYTYLNIFYKSTLEKKNDYLTTYDYLFRYDTDCHWLTKTLPGMETKIGRLLFGKWILSSTNLLTWAKRLSFILKYQKKPDVILDVFIPFDQFEKFYKLLGQQIDFYPLWIIPYKAPHHYPWVSEQHSKKMGSTLLIDCAIYGKRHDKKNVNYYKVLEDLTYECHGLKALIAHNSYDKDTFWRIYNQENYNKVKKITDPHNIFRDFYQKLHAKNS